MILNTSTLSLSDHFNGHIPGGIWVSQYQNVSVLDFIGATGDGSINQSVGLLRNGSQVAK